MSKDKKINWFGFCVQFFFGFIFGGILGLWFWSRSSYATSTSWIPGFLFIGGGAVLFGFIAGCARDDFWHSFRDSDWWKFIP
jgi:hypothetical protein